MAYRLSQINHIADSNSFNEWPLYGQKLGDVFPLSTLGLIVFHWADFSDTCEALEKQMKTDESLFHDFVMMKERVHSLRAIPLWIRTKNRTLQFSLYDLYLSYIQNNHTDRLDPHQPMDISFISGSGPFKHLAISECFNQQLYREMVMVLLVENKLPRRDFRIRIKAKVLVEYGDNYEHGHLLQIEQMTSHGVLFSCDSDFYFKQWSKIQKMRVLVNTEMMNEASQMSLEEMKQYFDQFPFNLMYSSKKEDAIYSQATDWKTNSGFDFFQQKMVYLFLPFDTVKDQHPESVQHLQGFIETTKSMVRRIGGV